MALPTDQTSSAATAATPSRTEAGELSSGVVTTFHDVPSQCSASVRLERPFWICPTAHTSVSESADTAYRKLERVPTFGLGTTFHEPHEVPGAARLAEVTTVAEMQDAATATRRAPRSVSPLSNRLFTGPPAVDPYPWGVIMAPHKNRPVSPVGLG